MTTMNESYLRQFDQLEQERQAIYEKIRPYDAEILRRNPDPDSWSAVQVMQHLLKTEQGTLTYIGKKLKYRTGIPAAGIGTRIRSFLLNLYLRGPIKAKAPGFLGEVDASADPEEVWAQWNTSRQNMREMIVAFPPEYAQHAILKHAFAGRITLAQTLSFLIEHQRRHTAQLERTLASVTQ